MMRALGASNDAELARFFGVEAPAVSAWRSRGIPKRVAREFERLRPDVPRQSAMAEARERLGLQVVYEGLCLAIWLAPSLDAFGRRFGATVYTARMREFASYFAEIETACAEEIEARRAQIGGNATDAFESLTREEPGPLLDRIMERARWWRDIAHDSKQAAPSPTLHDARKEFRNE